MISGKFIAWLDSIFATNKLIVCLTGMPGAGKSTIADGLKSRGYKIINMGDSVRAEAKKRNLDPTGANLGALMLELRRQNGPSAIAQLIRPEIDASATVIIDGVRSDDEIRFLRTVGDVKILSVHASKETRFGFLAKRSRSDDPHDKKNFDARDERELGVGISTSIALADESISNNNLTAEQLVDEAITIVKSWVD